MESVFPGFAANVQVQAVPSGTATHSQFVPANCVDSHSHVGRTRIQESVPFCTNARRRSFMERLKKMRAQNEAAEQHEKLLMQNVKDMLRQGFSLSEVTKVTHQLLGAKEPNNGGTQIHSNMNIHSNDSDINMDGMDLDLEGDSQQQVHKTGPAAFSKQKQRRHRQSCYGSMIPSQSSSHQHRRISRRANSFEMPPNGECLDFPQSYQSPPVDRNFIVPNSAAAMSGSNSQFMNYNQFHTNPGSRFGNNRTNDYTNFTNVQQGNSNFFSHQANSSYHFDEDVNIMDSNESKFSPGSDQMLLKRNLSSVVHPSISSESDINIYSDFRDGANFGHDVKRTRTLHQQDNR